MIPDHKKIATVIMGKIGPEASYGDKDMNDPEEGLHAAAEEVMDAVHAKDAKGLAQALKSFMEICSGLGEEHEGKEEEHAGEMA